MKKIIVLLLCLLCLTGCGKKNDEPVEEITYDYDFMNYINISYVGPNGYAQMDITLKDFSAKDFKSEDDYIKMKKLINSLFPHILATKRENISNGDIIQIGISDQFNYNQVGDLSINLNVHELAVNSLAEPKILNAFDESNVIFYGLDGTSKIYYYFPSGTKFSKEAQENLIYNIQIDDDTVQKDKTVLTLNVQLKDSLLNSSDTYGTIERYFGNQGYVINNTEEKILKNVVKESALANADKKVVRSAIEDQIKENGVDGYDFSQIMSIQKTPTPFNYYVVARFTNDTKTMFIKYSVSMAYVNNQVVIYSLNRESATEEAYSTKPYQDCEITFSYELFEIADDEIETAVEEISVQTDVSKEN